MARIYTQTKRIEKSYNVYLDKLIDFNKKGIATITKLTFNEYKEYYTKASRAGTKNIARTAAYEHNVVSTLSEARELQNRIKGRFGKDLPTEDFYTTKELRGLSGAQLWQYLKNLGLSDREAGAFYDGEKFVGGKTVKTRRERG